MTPQRFEGGAFPVPKAHFDRLAFWPKPSSPVCSWLRTPARLRRQLLPLRQRNQWSRMRNLFGEAARLACVSCLERAADFRVNLSYLVLWIFLFGSEPGILPLGDRSLALEIRYKGRSPVQTHLTYCVAPVFRSSGSLPVQSQRHLGGRWGWGYPGSGDGFGALNRCAGEPLALAERSGEQSGIPSC